MVKTQGAISENGVRMGFIKRFGKPIEEYDSFKRATEGVKPYTHINYVRDLAQFCLAIDEDPDSIIANRKADLFGDEVLNNERYERKVKAYIKVRNEANLSCNGTLGRIQGFFTNNSRRLSLDFGKNKLKYSKGRKRSKYSPSNQDARDLIANADSKRDPLIVSLMYHHGLDPVDFAGWKIGDYPEQPWVYRELSRSKTGEVCRLISTPDTCFFIKEYLTIRRGMEGEPLFMGREGPLDNGGISDVVRGLIVKSGLSKLAGFKPTSFRDAFEDALSEVKTYHKTKAALMGHTVDIEHDYGGYDKMVKALVEAMKTVYPIIALVDENKGLGLGVDQNKLAQLVELAPELVEIAKLNRAKKLLNKDDPNIVDKIVADPDLLKKLRDKGVIQ